MCGVIGISIKDVTEEDFSLIENVFLQSMIRGKHATGVSYYNDNKIITIKEPVSVDKFLENNSPNNWLNGTNIDCIGHIRYSTSDLNYNQPIASDKLSISHNGIITQEDPENWKDKFGYSTTTRNDSELILRCLENKDIVFKTFSGSSMAVCTLDYSGKITFFRNGQRPLYYGHLYNIFGKVRGTIVASTKDILVRSGIKHIFNTEMQAEYSIHDDSTVYIKETYITNKKDLQCI